MIRLTVELLDRIEARRLELGLDKSDLIVQNRVSPRTTYDILGPHTRRRVQRGRPRRMKESTLAALATRLGWTLPELLGREPEQATKEARDLAVFLVSQLETDQSLASRLHAYRAVRTALQCMPTSCELWNNAGAILISLGDHRAGYDALHAALDRALAPTASPPYAEAIIRSNLLKVAPHLQLDDEAIKHFDWLAHAGTNSPFLSTPANRLIQLGWAAETGERVSQLHVPRRVLLTPCRYGGWAYLRVRRLTTAATLLDRALRQTRTNLDALAGLAYIALLLNSRQRFESALQHFERTLDKWPDEGFDFDFYSAVYYALRQDVLSVLELLSRVKTARPEHLFYAATAAYFYSLHNEPAFRGLLAPRHRPQMLHPTLAVQLS